MDLEELEQGNTLREDIIFLQRQHDKISTHDFNRYSTITIDSRLFKDADIKLALLEGISRALLIKERDFRRL